MIFKNGNFESRGFKILAIYLNKNTKNRIIFYVTRMGEALHYVWGLDPGSNAHCGVSRQRVLGPGCLVWPVPGGSNTGWYGRGTGSQAEGGGVDLRPFNPPTRRLAWGCQVSRGMQIYKPVRNNAPPVLYYVRKLRNMKEFIYWVGIKELRCEVLLLMRVEPQCDLRVL